jgi:magnesium-transporting ATPase (P-type)
MSAALQGLSLGASPPSKPFITADNANQSEDNSNNDHQKTSIGDHGRQGLSQAEAEHLYEEVGYNELEHIDISPWKLFGLQFLGLMPYILEISCIIALAVGSYIDFAIILVILFANAIVGYHEEIKSQQALVSRMFDFKFYPRSLTLNCFCRMNLLRKWSNT